jgi:hypothetical protein
MTYETLFHLATGFAAPRPWQAELAAQDACRNRLINIPTGLGKTEAVALAWLWHRMIRGDERWPRRLVWCLPMRVLVEQTVDRIEAMLRRLSAADGSKSDEISVHQLMGGDAPPADLQPTRDDLCPVPVFRAREWLFDGGRLRAECRAWAWDYLDDEWQRVETRDLYPGQMILVAATWGGYDARLGFTGEAAQTTGPVVDPLSVSALPPEERADRRDSRDDLSEADDWKTIATHGREVGGEAAQLLTAVGSIEE